jgi:uncharacterized membrane protein YbhN (UPF0104 family)
MSVFFVVVIMAFLGTLTSWLPWAARRSNILDRVIRRVDWLALSRRD